MPDYASMGRLALLKECRSKGLDTSAISKDKDALVTLLNGGGGRSSESLTISKVEGQPWGMVIDQDSEFGLKIKKIKPGGAVATYPEIYVGRSCVAINGVDCKSSTKAELKALMKTSMTMDLVFGTDFPAQATMESPYQTVTAFASGGRQASDNHVKISDPNFLSSGADSIRQQFDEERRVADENGPPATLADEDEDDPSSI